MKDLSIIYVNYKSVELIRDSIQSFFYQTSLNLQIIVVDNSDEQTFFDPLKKEYNIDYINIGYNAGFARANNRGIQSANADIVLLLNPDTIILEDALDQSYYKLKGSSYVAGGVQLLNTDLSPQISGNYFIKGGLNHFLPLPVLGPIFRKIALSMGVRKTNLPDSDTLVEVDWINGAFLMVKKSAIEKAGLLDEDFFLYAEEIEWCSRLRKLSKLAIFGDCKVIHLQGETANKSFNSEGKGYYNLFDKKGLQLMVSNFLRIRKQFGVGWYLIHLAVYTMELVFLFLVFLVSSLIGSKKYPAAMVGGYARNLIRLYRLSPKILSNQPYFYKMG